MPGFISGKKRFTEINMCIINTVKKNSVSHSKSDTRSTQFDYESDKSLFPGLPDDVAKLCLALVPRSSHPSMAGVCKNWRSFIKGKDFITERKLAGAVEEWLYFLTMDTERKECHWEVFDCVEHKFRILPPMPGAVKAGFEVVVLSGKLLVIAGYSIADGTDSVSSDVYQYDSCLNRSVIHINLRNIYSKKLLLYSLWLKLGLFWLINLILISNYPLLLTLFIFFSLIGSSSDSLSLSLSLSLFSSSDF